MANKQDIALLDSRDAFIADSPHTCWILAMQNLAGCMQLQELPADGGAYLVTVEGLGRVRR